MQSAVGGTNRTRVPKMCVRVRVRLHSKKAATCSRSSDGSEDEESGVGQEVIWLGQWAVF